MKVTQFVRIDGKPGRPLQDFPVDGKPGPTYFPEDLPLPDGKKVPLYSAPVEFVKQMISTNPNRYKLCRGEQLVCQVTRPDLSRSWETFYPHEYRVIKTVQKFDEDGKPIKDVYAKEYGWVEVRGEAPKK